MSGSTTLPSAQCVSSAELLERGERLRPGLVERQHEAERLRRLPEITMAEFHEAGILRAIQPVVFGGFEADFINQIDLTYEISRACGASGWVYAVLSAHAAMIANFSERAQQEVWGANPRALASSSLSSMGRSSELPAATSSAATGAIQVAAISAPIWSAAPMLKKPMRRAAVRAGDFYCRSPNWRSSTTGMSSASRAPAASHCVAWKFSCRNGSVSPIANF